MGISRQHVEAVVNGIEHSDESAPSGTSVRITEPCKAFGVLRGSGVELMGQHPRCGFEGSGGS
jgi:hypothetical protein